MKKLGMYLPSLIISVWLVFVFVAGSAVLLADINITGDKCIALAEKSNIEEKIHIELEKSFRERYNSSGIPSEVYMNAIDTEYIRTVEQGKISAAFEMLEIGGQVDYEIPHNERLEQNIDTFLGDYADSIGYEKDEAFLQKLEKIKSNAYITIENQCDVYKVSALNEHGVLKKLSALYTKRVPITAGILAAGLVLLLLLVIVNRKEKITSLYWCGISAVISGAITLVPCVYLLASGYYNSFSIKQPQVFTAFTSAMEGLTEAMTAVQIAMIVLGIFLIVIYGVAVSKKPVADSTELNKK